MMNLNGLHLLLTYQCILECDHCFAWGSPKQSGTMTPEDIRLILEQAKELETLEWIYFEGGEPFLHYAVLRGAVEAAARAGFQVGIVTNSYWATSADSCRENLRPLAGLVQDLIISSDAYHWGEGNGEKRHLVEEAARELGIPLGVISVAGPGAPDARSSSGALQPGTDALLYRGRAAVRLASQAAGGAWDRYTTCPHEDLREPGRVHLDPFGYVHMCQGISIGNIHEQRLADLCAGYRPDEHPITGPLLEGGPAGLVRHYDLPLQGRYADACHLCYTARAALRERFPAALAPGEMYGDFAAAAPGS